MPSIYPYLSFLSPLTLYRYCQASLCTSPSFFPSIPVSFHSLHLQSSDHYRPVWEDTAKNTRLFLSYPPDVSPVWHKYSPSSPFSSCTNNHQTAGDVFPLILVSFCHSVCSIWEMRCYLAACDSDAASHPVFHVLLRRGDRSTTRLAKIVSPGLHPHSKEMALLSNASRVWASECKRARVPSCMCVCEGVCVNKHHLLQCPRYKYDIHAHSLI